MKLKSISEHPKRLRVLLAAALITIGCLVHGVSGKGIVPVARVQLQSMHAHAQGHLLLFNFNFLALDHICVLMASCSRYYTYAHDEICRFVLHGTRC